MNHDFSFLEQAKRLVNAAQEENTILRMLGALAVRHHCKNKEIFESLGRSITDIDLIGYSKQYAKLQSVLERRGLKESVGITSSYTGRLRFIGNEGLVVDIFLDKLDMCHTLDLRDRLHVDTPAIPIADVILEKMQIVNLTDKDIIDTLAIFNELEVGDDDNKTINANYISEVLAKDWGFYYTVTRNLKEVLAELAQEKYSILDREVVKNRIMKLIGGIDSEPKSARWRMRQKIGTKKKWYKDVQ